MQKILKWKNPHGFAVTHVEQRNGISYAVISHDEFRSTLEAIEYAGVKLGGNWIIPTVYVAGIAWQVNPKYSRAKWRWLLIRG